MTEAVTPIRIIGLPKLILWPEADRFQAYPLALARLSAYPELVSGATRRQIGERLFRLAYIEGHEPLRKDILINAFGLVQVGPQKLALRGINLFRRRDPASPRTKGLLQWETRDDLWLPTEEAVALGEAYARDSDGDEWKALLAEQLGRYEVRTRLLLLLLAEGRRLNFPASDVSASLPLGALLIGSGDPMPLFMEKARRFNACLFEQRERALGPWWREEIERRGYLLTEDFTIEGFTHSPPSTDYLNSHLSKALVVFRHLGILTDLGNGLGLDRNAAVRFLSPELVADLTPLAEPAGSTDPWEALRQSLIELKDEEGFVIAERLSARWIDLQGLPVREGENRFDDFVRLGLYEGRIQILASHPGQPRLGRGLLGDPDRRRVRLIVMNV